MALSNGVVRRISSISNSQAKFSITSFADQDLNRILVAGGDVGAPHYFTDVEVLDLAAIGSECAHPEALPGNEAAHAIGAYFGDHAVVCSGVFYSKTCHVYDPRTDFWFQLPGMEHPRYLAAEAVISEAEWWITGGLDADERPAADSDVMRPDGNVSPGPALVEPVYRHCAARVG